MKLPRRFYTAGWITLGALAAALEGLALADPGPMDTLSEQIWWILALHPLAWWAGLVGASWAIGHFFGKRPPQ